MTIDYKAIIAQLTVLLQGLFIKGLPLVETTGLAYLSKTTDRLEELAVNAASGNLSKDEVIKALEDEKDIFISELQSFEICGESFAQDVINNAEVVVTGILQSAIVKA